MTQTRRNDPGSLCSKFRIASISRFAIGTKQLIELQSKKRLGSRGLRVRCASRADCAAYRDREESAYKDGNRPHQKAVYPVAEFYLFASYGADTGTEIRRRRPGVSPKQALELGLKVDMAAVPKPVAAAIKAGKVDLGETISQTNSPKRQSNGLNENGIQTLLSESRTDIRAGPNTGHFDTAEG